MDYYSSKLLFAILVDDGRPRRRNHYDESVVLFRARNFDHAFQRALALGRAAEHRYKNGSGRNVRWALVEISTLDHVGRRLDGQEVASRLHDRTSRIPVPFSARFRPKKSRPIQSF
jgi:hypothetical protein